MRLENHYVWEYFNGKRWVRTRYHTDEKMVRMEHPEARPLLHTLIVREIAETEDEIWARMGNRHSALTGW